jgi:hypothetical protein
MIHEHTVRHGNNPIPYPDMTTGEKGFERYIFPSGFSGSVVWQEKTQFSAFLEERPDTLQLCKDLLVDRGAADG